MLFSIIVPVYNSEKFIGKCIDSVLSQTVTDFELILVDDGSTDSSGNICDLYAEKYSCIKVLHQHNQGPLKARKAGVAEASGEYLLWIDSDDTVHPALLETVQKKFELTGCDCVIYGFNLFIDNKLLGTMGDSEDSVVEDKRTLYSKVFSDPKYNSMCNKAVRRSVDVLSTDPRFDGKLFSEDLLQSIGVYRSCRKVCFIKDKLYNYRMNPDSSIHSRVYGYRKIDFDIKEYVFNFLLEQKVFTTDDFDRYSAFCVKMLMRSTVKIISLFDLPYSRKTELLDSIAGTSYYKLVCRYDFGKYLPVHYRLLFGLYRKKRYRALLFSAKSAVKARDALRRIRILMIKSDKT